MPQQQIIQEGMRLSDWLWSGAGIGTCVLLGIWFLKRGINRSDHLEDDNEKRQNVRIKKVEDRCDEMSTWMSARDEERGHLVDRDKIEEIVEKAINAEKEIREAVEEAQDRRLDILESRNRKP